MIKIITAISLAATLLVVPAVAEEPGPPRYDVERMCRDTTEAMGGGEFLLSSCFNQEQSSYDALKARWGEIPERIRTYCDETTRAMAGGYFLLSACIQQEERSAAENADRTFRY